MALEWNDRRTSKEGVMGVKGAGSEYKNRAFLEVTNNKPKKKGQATSSRPPKDGPDDGPDKKKGYGGSNAKPKNPKNSPSLGGLNKVSK